MVSYLSHQRAVSFSLGLAAAFGVYISTRKLIWKSAANTADSLPGAPPPPEPLPAQEPLFGPGARSTMVQKWNEGVDSAFKPIIKALAERNL